MEDMNNSVKSGLRDTVYVYIEIILTKIISFFIPLILIRNLSKTDYGVYSLILSILTVIACLFSFGFEDIFLRYIPEFLSKKKYKRVNNLLFKGSAVRFVSMSVILFLLFTFRETVYILLNSPPVFDKIFILILFFVGINRITFLIGDMFMMACHRRHHVSVIRLVKESLRLIFFIAVIYFVGGGLYHILLAMVVYSFIDLSIYVVLDIKTVCLNYKRCRRNNINVEADGNPEQRRIGRYQLFSILSRGMGAFKNLSADYLIISYYMSVEAVANYSIACFFPRIVKDFSPLTMLSGVLTPIMVKQYSHGNKVMLKRFFSFFFNINCFLLLPMSAGALIFSDKIIYYIFDPKYMEVLKVVYLLVPVLLIANLADPYYIITNVIEKKEIIFISSVWAVYNLIMCIILIPLYGIMGAAIATGSAGVLNYIYFWVVYRYVLKIRLNINYGSLLKMTVVTAVMALMLLLLRTYVDSIIKIILAILSGGVVYLALSMLIKPFPAEERDFINSKLNKKCFVF